MFAFAYEPETLTLIVRSYGECGPAEVDQLVSCMRRLSKDARSKPGRTSSFLLVSDAEYQPTREEMKRMMQAALEIPAVNHALVSGSVIVRTLSLATTLISPPPKAHRRSTHADVQSAIAWLDEYQPGIGAYIVPMIEQVGAELAA